MFLNDFTSNNGFRVSKKDLAEIMSNAEIRAFTVLQLFENHVKKI